MSSSLSSPQRRLRDMEVLLLWEGSLDNARLREVFGVQAVQASRLLASFLAVHGDGVKRETPHSPITPGASFTPKHAGASPDEYLELLSTMRPRMVAPFLEDLRQDLSPVSPQVFAAVAQACLKQVGLQISYRSLSNSEGNSRLVFPHSVVRAARRWHMRAWCDMKQDYRDFALGRITQVSIVDKPSSKTKAEDVDWNASSNLVIVPHPLLSEGQAGLLRDEYLSGKSERTVVVRKSLASYTIQDLRLAVDVARQVPPEYQLALKNIEDFGDAFALRVR